MHTVAGSAARLAISDEGEMYVTADSLVGVTQLPASIKDKFTLLTLLTGEVFTVLSAGTLQIQTPLALVEIRASAMRVSYDAKTSNAGYARGSRWDLRPGGKPPAV